MKQIIFAMILWLPTLACAEEPTMHWMEVGVGTIENAGSWNEETRSGDFSRVYFVRGVLQGGESSSRLVVHGRVGGAWVEDPWNIHVEPLSDFDSTGTRAFVVQIPGEALVDSIEIWLSLVTNEAIQLTFDSRVLTRSESDLSFHDGRPLPAGASLHVASDTIRSRGKPAPYLIPEVRHVVPEGEKPPRKAR